MVREGNDIIYKKLAEKSLEKLENERRVTS